MVIYAFGHAGDGNIHLNFTASSQKRTDQVEKGIKAVLAEVLAMDGTISGEHGIGIAKKPYLPLELQEESVRLQKGIKKLFDPEYDPQPGENI